MSGLKRVSMGGFKKSLIIGVSTYWPATYVGNRILNDFLRGVSQHDSSFCIVPLILEAGRVAIVGIHCGDSLTVGSKQTIETKTLNTREQ